MALRRALYTSSAVAGWLAAAARRLGLLLGPREAPEPKGLDMGGGGCGHRGQSGQGGGPFGITIISGIFTSSNSMISQMDITRAEGYRRNGRTCSVHAQSRHARGCLWSLFTARKTIAIICTRRKWRSSSPHKKASAHPNEWHTWAPLPPAPAALMTRWAMGTNGRGPRAHLPDCLLLKNSPGVKAWERTIPRRHQVLWQQILVLRVSRISYI